LDQRIYELTETHIGTEDGTPETLPIELAELQAIHRGVQAAIDN
jgi:hypothetical protein